MSLLPPLNDLSAAAAGVKNLFLYDKILSQGIAVYLFYALHVDDNRKISVSNDPGHEKQYFSLYSISLSSLYQHLLLILQKDFYSPAKLIFFCDSFVYWCCLFQFVTNAKSSC